MGIVLMSINGVGLGHLSRMAEISEHLYEKGERPVLFYQSKKFPFGEKPFHKVQIESLLRTTPEYLDFIEDKVNTACRISEPAIYIEDTHPARINLKNTIGRFIVVRPTTFSYLLTLKERYPGRYDAFFIADDPASPTWPYDSAETATLASWKDFHIIGPVFRKPGAKGISKVRTKYNWKADVPLIVFSMGGGGQHPDANDTSIFVEKITSLSPRIRSAYPGARFLFVKGPLYAAGSPLPEGFEIIAEEEEMPALFAIATLAVIRPGFNSTWECINAQTPFYYIEGTTYSEPIKEKLQKLESLGLASNSNVFDAGYRQRYEKACRETSARWTGRPNDTFMKVISEARNILRERLPSLSSGHASPCGISLSEAKKKFREASALLSGKRFFLRIDDVVEMTDELRFIWSQANQWNIFVSLEVIPYLCKLTEEELLPYDPDYSRMIVGQHGFGHVVNLHNPPGVRSEFRFSDQGCKEEVANLHKGKNYLEKQFPKRFGYGFSAPFDCFPDWLPGTLQEGDWKYMIINQHRYYADMPAYKARVDLWNWKEQKIKTPGQLFEQILNRINDDGYFGLIVHPVHFKSQVNRDLLSMLFAELSGAGYKSQNFIQNSMLSY